MPKLPKLYRDATTGQYTTAEDAAARPAETVAETVEAHHETPDVAELRRLAEAATPGPWAARYGVSWEARVCATTGSLADVDSTANAELIAAANPAVVLALLDERDALAAKVERVRALHKSSGDAETQGYAGLGYGYISPYCMGEVASDEYGVPWPCETIRAIDGGES